MFGVSRLASSVLAVLSTMCSAAPSASGDATVVSRSRETNSRRLQTPAEDHHDGHQQHNNLHADDSKISRIQPLRSYASTAFADLPSHFETTIHNNNKMHQQPRYHRNHINYHTAKLHETPNSAKQSRHHYGSSTDGGKKLTNQEVLRWVTIRARESCHQWWRENRVCDIVNEPRNLPLWKKNKTVIKFKCQELYFI